MKVGLSWGIVWRVSAEDVICVAVEEDGAEVFGEEVSQVDGSVNALEFHQVPFHPFTDDLVLYIHMARTRGWFLCHSHRSAGIVVFVEDRCSGWGIPRSQSTLWT